jgi:hypothetical protein
LWRWLWSGAVGLYRAQSPGPIRPSHPTICQKNITRCSWTKFGARSADEYALEPPTRKRQLMKGIG